MAEPVALDARLMAIAELAMQAVEEKAHPCVADVGCDHGYLTAYLLKTCPQMTALACDVSAPSLGKARRLMAKRGLTERVRFAVADGLAAIDAPVDVIVLAGMGAETILSIVRAGRDRVGQAALIVQANTDLPMLRAGLAQMGFAARREVYVQAAGRRYVTMCMRAAQPRTLTAREALLGAAAQGAQDAQQRAYFAWQRDVRVREMQQAATRSRAGERMAQNRQELTWISEALGMKTCRVSDVRELVGGIAPFELAEEWDNVGLLFGHAQAEAERILVALDLTQGVLDEAKALGAQMIVTHHPIMFSARKRVTDEDREGRLILGMAEAGIAHIAAHTNLDAAPGGVNDTLMAEMGAANIEGEGCVRAGDLPEGTTLGALAALAERRLRGPVRVYGAKDTPVHRLGCCSGAGGSEIAEAKALGADCFITGEVRHHEALDAVNGGMCVLEAGHFETENPVCEVLAQALQKAADALQYKVTVFCSKGNPFGR